MNELRARKTARECQLIYLQIPMLGEMVFRADGETFPEEGSSSGVA